MVNDKTKAEPLGGAAFKDDFKHVGRAKVQKISDSDKSALKNLYILIERENRQKHPDIPYPLKAKKLDLRKTNDLTTAVVKYIRLNGGFAEKVTNTGRLIDNRKLVSDVLGRKSFIGSTKWIPGSGRKGRADVEAIYWGRSIKIEIKNTYTKDVQRPQQLQYQAEVQSAGAFYIIVTSFSQFVEDWETITMNLYP